MRTGTSHVDGHTYIQKDIVLILTKGGKGSRAALDREEKSLKCEEVITYFVVASVHCAGAHDCLANKKRNNPSSFLPMDF